MSGSQRWKDTSAAPMENRSETPPPPYNLEDDNPHSTSIVHDPELAELDTGVPYQVRGLSPFIFRARLKDRSLTSMQMMAASTLISIPGSQELSPGF